MSNKGDDRFKQPLIPSSISAKSTHIPFTPRTILNTPKRNDESKRLDERKCHLDDSEELESVTKSSKPKAATETAMCARLKAILCPVFGKKLSSPVSRSEFLPGKTIYCFESSGLTIQLGSASEVHSGLNADKVIDVLHRALNPPEASCTTSAEDHLAPMSLFADDIEEYRPIQLEDGWLDEDLPDSVQRLVDYHQDFAKADSDMFKVDQEAVDSGGLFGFSGELPSINRSTQKTVEVYAEYFENDDDEVDEDRKPYSKKNRLEREEKKIDRELSKLA